MIRFGSEGGESTDLDAASSGSCVSEGTLWVGPIQEQRHLASTCGLWHKDGTVGKPCYEWLTKPVVKYTTGTQTSGMEGASYAQSS